MDEIKRCHLIGRERLSWGSRSCFSLPLVQAFFVDVFFALLSNLHLFEVWEPIHKTVINTFPKTEDYATMLCIFVPCMLRHGSGWFFTSCCKREDQEYRASC